MSLKKLFITYAVAGKGENADDRGQQIGIERSLYLSAAAGHMPFVQFRRSRLRAPVVAERAQCTDQFAAKLPGQLVLSRPWVPAEIRHGGSHAIANQRF